MLVPIDSDNAGEAVALLARGLAARPPGFWQDGIARVARFHQERGLGPVGHLLRHGGGHAGVILTLRSLRLEAGGAPRRVVNLSSWFIEERQRLLAAPMLKAVLAEPDTLYTDLTPTDAVCRMIGRFGFRPWNEGALVAALPLAAAAGGGRARILAGAALAAALAPPARRLAEDHEAFGCLAAALETPDGPGLLVFAPTRRLGVPSVRLVHADSKRAVLAHFPAVARFLLARGIALAEIPARADERLAGARFTRRQRPTFFRGEMDPDRIDHAYSEFVLLRL